MLITAIAVGIVIETVLGTAAIRCSLANGERPSPILHLHTAKK